MKNFARSTYGTPSPPFLSGRNLNKEAC